MTDQKLDLAAIKARAEKATPPFPTAETEPCWRRGMLPGYYNSVFSGTAGKLLFKAALGDEIKTTRQMIDDCEFIAHARQDIPALVEALEAEESEVGRLRVALGQYARHELNCGDAWRGLGDLRRCDCGLDAALRGE